MNSGIQCQGIPCEASFGFLRLLPSPHSFQDVFVTSCVCDLEALVLAITIRRRRTRSHLKPDWRPAPIRLEVIVKLVQFRCSRAGLQLLRAWGLNLGTEGRVNRRAEAAVVGVDSNLPLSPPLHTHTFPPWQCCL